MFLPFFQSLREEGVPVSLREFLSFLEAMAAGLVIYDPEAFYHLARLTLVKDERHIDRFDRAFARAFGGLEAVTAETSTSLAAHRLDDESCACTPACAAWRRSASRVSARSNFRSHAPTCATPGWARRPALNILPTSP